MLVYGQDIICIRQETPADYDIVYQVVTKAFENAEHSDGQEQNLVVRLRKSRNFIPQLSLVAEVENKIAGYILFTKLKAGSTIQLALAPLAVLPEWQKQGIGGRLIAEGHRIARELGYEFSILIGYPSYYSRFGYVAAAEFGFSTDWDLPSGVFMACDLQNSGRKINAKVEYSEEFF